MLTALVFTVAAGFLGSLKGHFAPLPVTQPQGKSSVLPRFERQYPLPGLLGIMMDRVLQGGIAISACRANRLQARILWIDCTANIERYNTDEKIVALMAQIKDAGFNTVVFDVKPISGQVVFPSKFAPKLLEWRNQRLPADFDALLAMSREAKASGLSFFVSLNALSEGHALFKVGPGYERPSEQTVLYEPKPQAILSGASFPMRAVKNADLAEESLSAFVTQSKIPAASIGQFAITIAKDGTILDGFANGGVENHVPVIPAEGCVLVGLGSGAEWLRAHAIPGDHVKFDSIPEFVPISERPDQQYPLMMNPNDPRAQDRAINLLREIVTGYPVDGIIYDDRFRYAGLNADFSEISRRAFESYIGKQIHWPDDVYKYRFGFDFNRGITPGPYFQAWLNWRAASLRDLAVKVRSAVQAIKPAIEFGLYQGSWFGEYARFGTHYGSPNFDGGFWYLTPEYRVAGIAPLLDFVITGCYYPTATIYEAMENGDELGATIEYAGYLTNQVLRDSAWPYAGISLSQFKNNPDGLELALQAACGSTCGVMVFDLSHDIEPMWPVFKRAFFQPMAPPHADRKLLETVRSRRALADRLGLKSPPVIIAPGLPGAGH